MGSFGSVAAETGLLYNVEVLAKAYAGMGGLYTVIGTRNVFSVGLVIALVILLLRFLDEKALRLDVGCIALITITANSLFWIFMTSLQRISSRLKCRCYESRSLDVFGVLLLVLYSLSITITHDWVGCVRALTICFCGVYYLVTLLHLLALVSMDPSRNDQQSTFVGSSGSLFSVVTCPPQKREIIFAAWTFPLLPLLLAGNVYVSFKRPNKWIPGAWPYVIVPCVRNVVVRKARLKQRQEQQKLRQEPPLSVVAALQVIRIAILSWNLVGRYWFFKEDGDEQHYLAWALLRFAMVDIMEGLPLVFREQSHLHGS